MTIAANKTVLITAAGGGFGRQLVRQFRFAPWLLPLLDRRMQAQSIKAGRKAD